MKILPSVGILLAGICMGILAGRISSVPSGHRGSEMAEGPEKTRANRTGRTNNPAPDIQRIRRASPKELVALTRQTIRMADPVERKRQLAECLLHMSVDNWEEMVASFNDLSNETGRDDADGWRLALFRAGQIAGAGALDSLLVQGVDKKNSERRNFLSGWSTRNPEAALEWLRKAEAAGQKIGNDSYSAVIEGAALTDPEAALKLLAAMPADRRKDCAGNLTWSVVQNGGTQALDSVLEYAAKLRASDPASSGFAENLIRESTDKLLWQADHARDVDQACEIVSKLARYGGNPTEATARVIAKYRYYNMETKLQLLETVRSSQPELDVPLLTAHLIGTMNGSADDAAVREWILKNPDSTLVPGLLEKVGSTP